MSAARKLFDETVPVGLQFPIAGNETGQGKRATTHNVRDMQSRITPVATDDYEGYISSEFPQTDKNLSAFAENFGQKILIAGENPRDILSAVNITAAEDYTPAGKGRANKPSRRSLRSISNDKLAPV